MILGSKINPRWCIRPYDFVVKFLKVNFFLNDCDIVYFYFTETDSVLEKESNNIFQKLIAFFEKKAKLKTHNYSLKF